MEGGERGGMGGRRKGEGGKEGEEERRKRRGKGGGREKKRRKKRKSDGKFSSLTPKLELRTRNHWTQDFHFRLASKVYQSK